MFVMSSLNVYIAVDGLDMNAIDAELQAAQARWALNKPHSYKFELERSCFCVEDFRGPFEITVHGDVVADVQFMATDLLGNDMSDELRGGISTVEGLFSKVKAEVQRGTAPAALEAQYDTALGFPTRIEIDRAAEIQDDDLTYLVTKFRSLV
eukprot:CAMPEP_0113525274 /NCGR_PEP_ID=MMETSP0015_2-20120614/65_1 /TAXON_ID=2838 /ORGANISM="Odontella" /LENGTH=151 /DNA_ID=CAMNT_0000423411 /DNA_START=124 /DNA_END=579 /DNA_ORIENTATION=+ /assembly_acc=CAM_ASM_000160